jgi:hypothetical protein
MSTKTIVKRTPSGLPALAYRDGGEVMMTMGGGPKAQNAAPAGSPAEHLSPTASFEETLGAYTNHWVPWGLGDDHPRRVALMMRKSTVGRAGLQRITKTIYGQRLFTYKITGYDDESNPIIKQQPLPEWEQIKSRSNFDMVRLGLVQDYAYYGINFPEIRFNGNKTKVFGIDYQKASHTRLDLMDPDTGYIPFVYVSGRFPNVTKPQCQQIKVIDFIRYFDQMDEIRADITTQGFKYIMPQFWPDVLNDYYPEVYWYSAKEHIEIATSIPIYKKALFKNQMSLKYEIQIPFEYFYELYPDFKTMTPDAQDVIVDALYDDIIKNLTGAENAQKAIMSFYKTGPNGQAIGQWVIKVIDDKMKNDAYLPDETASGTQIQFAMMLNPALSGQGNTGGDMSGGANNGGSNIRESGLDVRSMVQADRDITNSYFKFCSLYNGWDPDIQLGVQDMVLTTLDTGGGSKSVVS